MAVLYGPFQCRCLRKELEDDVDRTLERKEQEYNRLPDEVLWENGRRASLDDYRRHLDCTSMMVDTVPCCMEQHFAPDIVADVRYDHFAGQWAISGDGVEPTGLLLTYPNAPDEQIIAELFTLPVVYRARIHR